MSESTTNKYAVKYKINPLFEGLVLITANKIIKFLRKTLTELTT